jgi:hypothetical protein
MKSTLPMSFRIAACPEISDQGHEWSFYVINDSNVPLDRIVLETFEHEWGIHSDISHPNVEITNVASGAHAFLWREKDNEFRMLLYLCVHSGEGETRYYVKFPTLYSRRNELPLLDELNKSGWAAPAVLLP